MMSGEGMKYLCSALNSMLVCWYMTHQSPTSGTGALRWKRTYAQNIPVPALESTEQRAFVSLVDRIQAAKSSSVTADTIQLEREIDQLVYDLYRLTEEEIAAVEARVSV